MPNYLGSEELFKKKFSTLFTTNIFSFSDENLVFSDQQHQILKDLHRRVMPFIMRRTKDQVLKELPPKIIADYHCEPSDYQNQLYSELEENEIKDCEQQLDKGTSDS